MRDTPRQYHTSDGFCCSLDELVRNEPEWAANQIRHRDKIERELNEAKRINMQDYTEAGWNAAKLAVAERDAWRKVADELAASEKCPNCDDVGWFTEWHRTTGGDPEPEQCQCEFCETNPKSRFKALAAYEKLKSE